MDTINVTASFPFHFKPERLIYHRLQDCDGLEAYDEFALVTPGFASSFFVQSLLFVSFVHCAVVTRHFESRQNDATSRGRVKCHVTSSLFDPEHFARLAQEIR